MRISIRHETRYDYEAPVAGLVMRLRLVPPDTSAQTVHGWQVSVNDVPVERWIASGHGDGEALWRGQGHVSQLSIVAQGEVSTLDTSGVTRHANGAARPMLFLRETPLTAPSEALIALAEKARSPSGLLDSLHRLCGAVHGGIAYKPGSTRFETSAAEALEQGSGVCQDQAHVFIAAARALGIPARYVTGYLHDPDRPDSEHDPHAWAEGWVDGLGWVAFDPSLGSCPAAGHVRLTVGLDAADAAPIRAVASRGAEARPASDVQIGALPLDGAAQAQIQQQ